MSEQTRGGRNPEIINDFIQESQPVIGDLEQSVQTIERELENLERLSVQLSRLVDKHEPVNAMNIQSYIDNLRDDIGVLERSELTLFNQRLKATKGSLDALMGYFNSKYIETIRGNGDDEKFDWM